MDLLKKEMARKKKAVEMAKKKNAEGSSPSSSSFRFLRAGDIRRMQEEQEEEERHKRRKYNATDRRSKAAASHANCNNDDADRGDGVRRQDHREAERVEKRARLNSTSNASDSMNEGEASNVEQRKDEREKMTRKTAMDDAKGISNVFALKLTPLEVTCRLREMGLPVRLFGERTIRIEKDSKKEQEKKKYKYDDTQRMQRITTAMEKQKHDMAGRSEMDEFRLGRGHGIRNPFLGGKKERDRQEQTATLTLHEQEQPPTNLPTQQKNSKEASNISTTTATTAGTMAIKIDYNDADLSKDPHKKIHTFFKTLLRQWGDDLGSRSETVKRSISGKNETKTLKQCTDYIRPLFKQCKSRRLEPSIMAKLLEIVNFAIDGEFVKAHDAYIDVAIGRAAWPIGVTMVGIHARSGRAKIESSNVAHVMNSELQRKYLTSVKRLLTYNQKIRKDVAPSKKVMN